MSGRPPLFTVAVDVDETLAPFATSYLGWHNSKHGTRFSLGALTGYDFPAALGLSPPAAVDDMNEFLASPVLDAVVPIPGAQEVLAQHATAVRFIVVSARDKAIAARTLAWLHKHFPNTFEGAYFGSSALSGATSKAEIAATAGAAVLIDDSPVIASSAAALLPTTLLFGDYPWSPHPHLDTPRGVFRAFNWAHVDAQLWRLRHDAHMVAAGGHQLEGGPGGKPSLRTATRDTVILHKRVGPTPLPLDMVARQWEVQHKATFTGQGEDCWQVMEVVDAVVNAKLGVLVALTTTLDSAERPNQRLPRLTAVVAVHPEWVATLKMRHGSLMVRAGAS